MIQKYLSLILFLLICTSFFKGHKENSSVRPNKDFALFFAVEDYDQWQDLRNPISDATSIAQELETNYGFQTEVVKNPTRADIYKKLDEYRKRTYASDAQLMVFFTGHGEFTEATKEGFFVPRDGRLNDPYQDTYIPHTRLERSINSIPCEHILLAIDACFSGTFDELIALNKGDTRPGANQNRRQDFINRTLKYKSRLYITSGGKERTPDQSQFAQQFLSALRGFGGKDNIVSFSELVTSLEAAKPLPKNGQFGDNEIGSNFLFVLNSTDNSYRPQKDNANRRADFTAWENAERVNSISTYQIYLQNHPNGLFATKARQNIRKLEDDMDWKITTTLNTQESYQDYINRHPTGQFIAEAKSKVQLKKRKTTNNNDFERDSGTFTDSRDGQTYNWAQMKDNRIWMAENLNYKTSDSYCYDNKESNCNKYGRLYTWLAARKVCPSGWHLPSRKEWDKLLENYGGIGTSAYQSLIEGSRSEFQSLLGGNRGSGGEFYGLGEYDSYWSATEYDADYARFYYFIKANGLVDRSNFNKADALSCRCIKD